MKRPTSIMLATLAALTTAFTVTGGRVRDLIFERMP